MNFNDNLTF